MTAAIPDAAINSAQEMAHPIFLAKPCGSGYPMTMTTTGSLSPFVVSAG
jgi:hypothetical protein